MPHAPQRPCLEPGCSALVTSGRCDQHKNAARSPWQHLYGSRWQRARKRFLEQNPICKLCRDADKAEIAFAVDHIVPHRGNLELFWDVSNWQPLCEAHHNAKAQSERMYTGGRA